MDKGTVYFKSMQYTAKKSRRLTPIAHAGLEISKDNGADVEKSDWSLLHYDLLREDLRGEVLLHFSVALID